MNKMNWKRIGIYTSIVLFVALLFSNPSQEQHKLALKDKFIHSITEELEKQENTGMEELQLSVATIFIDNMVDKTVTRDNWFLFSTTKITIDGDEKTIGFGILGYVYLSSKIDEALNEGLK
jgi:hypothetical protein